MIRYLKSWLGITLIQRYVIKEFLSSFLVSFLFFFFIFLINQLLLMAQRLLEAHLPIPSVLLLLYYALPIIMMLSFPFATLVGTLMSLANLSSTNQILAIRSCGISISWISRPLFFLSVLFSIFSFFFNDYFLPLGLIKSEVLQEQLITNNPSIVIEPFSSRRFQTEGGGETYLITSEVKNKVFHDLVIMDTDIDGRKRSFVAAEATIAPDSPPGVVGILLRNVRVIIGAKNSTDSYSLMEADTLLYNILLGSVRERLILTPGQKQAFVITRELREKQIKHAIEEKNYEMTTARLHYQIHSEYNALHKSGSGNINIAALIERQQEIETRDPILWNFEIQSYKIEIYQKFSLPLSCIPFVVLAFSLGLTARRYGRSVGFLLGLFISFLYWAALIGGKMVAYRTRLSPSLLMFGADVLILIIGVYLYMRERDK